MTITINLRGVDFTVDYEYYRGEPRTDDYPGTPPEVEINNIYLSDIEIYDFLDDNIIEELTDKIYLSYE